MIETRNVGFRTATRRAEGQARLKKAACTLVHKRKDEQGVKVRVITGVVGALLAIGIICLAFTPILTILLPFFCAMATFEILHVAQVKNKALYVIGILTSFCVPPIITYDLVGRSGLPLTFFLMLYVMVLLVCMLARYHTTKFEHVAITLYASLFIPLAISSLLLLRDLYKAYPGQLQQSHAIFFILLSLFACWISDAAAYFVGRKFGKHKLAPNISPKKSVEGAIAGVLVTSLLSMIMFFICDHFYFYMDTIKWWMVLPMSLLLPAISILGDLSASVLKRNFGKKDYGTIMPGHGGIMDRFDSYVFSVPATWMAVTLIMRFVA